MTDFCYICMEDCSNVSLLTCCKGKYICENCKQLCKNCPFCRHTLPTHRTAIRIVPEFEYTSDMGKLVMTANNYRVVEMK